MVGLSASASRWFLLGAACVQNGLTTGLLFGFAALQPALRNIAGVDDLTDYSQIFTLAISANMFSPLLLAGPLLDAFGPRMCSCVSTFLVGAGFFLFGVSAHLPGESMSYLLPAMVLIGVGGPGCQCCLFHTANLFQARGMALNLITAFIGPSFVVFELLSDVSTWCDLHLQRAFLFYSSMPFLCTFVSIFTMRDVPFSSSDAEAGFIIDKLAAFEAHMACAEVRPRSFRSSSVRAISLGAARPIIFVRRKKTTCQDVRSPGGTVLAEPLVKKIMSLRERFPPIHQHAQGAKSEERRLQRSASGACEEDAEDDCDELMNAPLRDQLRSAAFAEVALVFATSSLFYNLFIGNMQDEAKAVLLASSTSNANISETAASYVSVYLSFAPLSTLLNPCLGYCIDNFGFRPILFVLLCSGVTHALALWCRAFFMAAAVFSLFQASAFSYMYSYLAFKFGFEYYGLLAGLVQCFASICTLTLQPGLCRLAAVHGWSFVQRIQIASFALLGVCLGGISLASQRSQTRCQQREKLNTGNGVSGVHEISSKQRSEDPERCSDTTANGFEFKRCYSDGDLHMTECGLPCRRRSEHFPNVDDILLIDGAHGGLSHEAYHKDTSP